MKQVTAAIWLNKGKVLIAQRPPGDKLERLWEFPGGKVEAGESPRECLRRELAEELGVNVDVGGFFGRSVYDYKSGCIELLAYLIDASPQKLTLRAHSAAYWVGKDELDRFTFAPADIPLVEQLKLYMES